MEKANALRGKRKQYTTKKNSDKNLKTLIARIGIPIISYK